MSGPTVAERLAAWSSAVVYGDLPESVRAAARRHLLDGFGTALAARRAGVVDAAVRVALALGGPAEASVLGTSSRVSAPAAALANGALVHGLDFDDTHAGGLVHATAIVLPTMLAVGQQVGADGPQALTAAVVGYETVCRVAAGSPHGFHARGLHATQVAGTLAAAAVASRLLGLDAPTTTNALGIAGSSSGGLMEFLTTGASTKQLHPGAAAMSGILAARLAAAGASGPATVLEGPHGLYAALSDRPADPESVVAGLGTRWETTEITIKPYPSCQLMHATLDAVRAALAGVPDVAGSAGVRAPADVVEVVADVHPDSAAVVSEPASVKVAPRTPYDAKFSLPWSVAALLVDGEVTVATYDPASIARPEIAALAARVRSVPADSAVVAADAPGHVRLRLADGRTVDGAVERSIGGPAAPLSDDAVLAKFLANAGPTEQARGLAAALAGLGVDPATTPAVLATAAAAAASAGGGG
jgi:2-methylcitrate dehydratase PrpD